MEDYLHDLRPARSEVMAEMEAVAQRDSVPIGYSTLHLAEALSAGRVTTLEIDPDRARQARGFWSRAGVAERIELIEGDARETIPILSGPFDLLFVDAAKASTASTSTWRSHCSRTARCS